MEEQAVLDQSREETGPEDESEHTPQWAADDDNMHYYEEAARQEAPPALPGVYTAMGNVARRIASQGVPKKRTMQGRGPYRGVDDIMNALAGALSQEGLLILPETLKYEVADIKKEGTSLTQQAIVDMQFTFFHAPTGTERTLRMAGHAHDTADRALQKAQTFAYKQLCVLVFCIPVEGLEGDEGRETIQHKAPPIPHMGPPGPPRLTEETRACREGIETLLEGAGKTGPEIDAYVARLKAKYGAELESRLPGIYQSLQDHYGAAKRARPAGEHAFVGPNRGFDLRDAAKRARPAGEHAPSNSRDDDHRIAEPW